MSQEEAVLFHWGRGGYNFKNCLFQRRVCFFMHILRGAYESLMIPLTDHGIYNAEKYAWATFKLLLG